MKKLILKLLIIIYKYKYTSIIIKRLILFIITFYYNLLDKEEKKYTFPWSRNGKIKLIGVPLFIDKDKYSYYAQYYEEAFLIDSIKITENYKYKVEIYKAKLYNKFKIIKLKFIEESLLPISFLDNNFLNSNLFIKDNSIDIYVNNKKHILEGLIQNRYHKLIFNKGDHCTIKTNKNILVGKPISLVQNITHKKKFILTIFIDAFSASLFEKYPLEELAPNTYNFFSKGVIFDKCYSNAEFTTTSLSSMSTGKYVHKNNFYHPRIRQTIGTTQKMINQYFKDEDYFTQLISGNYGQNPSQGYCQGYDRTIYKNSLKHQEVIYELIDSFRVFKNRDIFTWLSIFDVHHPLNELPSFSACRDIKLDGHNYARDADAKMTKTTFRTYCPKTTERHIAEIKKIDYHLKFLYDFIENNFNDDNMLISFVSDHAASFVIDSKKKGSLLRKEKTNVPFMIRGTSYKNIRSSEVIENVDILPTILNSCNIQYNENHIDGKIPKVLGGKGKDYIFTESIYPGQTYKASIKDDKYECFLEGKALMKDDGKINLKKYKFEIECILTGNKITDNNIINSYKNKFKKILKEKFEL
jgi:hypothetical protein